MVLRRLWKCYNLKLNCFVCYKQSNWLKKVITCIYHISKYSWHRDSHETHKVISSDLPCCDISVNERSDFNRMTNPSLKNKKTHTCSNTSCLGGGGAFFVGWDTLGGCDTFGVGGSAIFPRLGLTGSSGSSYTSYSNTIIISHYLKLKSNQKLFRWINGLFLKGLSGSLSYGSWIYNYLCNQCLSLLMLWVQILLRWGVLDTTLCDKVCQWFV